MARTMVSLPELGRWQRICSVSWQLERRCMMDTDDRLAHPIWQLPSGDCWVRAGDEAKGRALLTLDIGLAVVELEGDIAACVNGDRELPARVLDAVDRRGRSIRCGATATPLRDVSGEIQGAILLVEPLGDSGP